MNKINSAVVKKLLHLSALLPLPVARGLGRFAAAIYWLFGGRSRKVTLKNIRGAYPQLSDSEQRALARRSLLATGEVIVEMGHIWMKP